MFENWVNSEKLIMYSKNGILSKELFKSKRTNLTLFSMHKGTEMSEHTSAREGFVYVLEGKGIFTLQKEKILMKKGVLIHLEKDAIHALKADQNMSFMLYLF